MIYISTSSSKINNNSLVGVLQNDPNRSCLSLRGNFSGNNATRGLIWEPKYIFKSDFLAPVNVN